MSATPRAASGTGVAAANRASRASPVTWHLVTGEYPPTTGGVADYTVNVARALAQRGSEIHVWCPGTSEPHPETDGVRVHTLLGDFGVRAIARCDRALSRFPRPRHLLVQWVPHAYGWRSLNLAFALWVLKRGRVDRDDVQLVVHEPFLPFTWRGGLANLGAIVHRVMLTAALLGARRVWVTTPAWESRIRKYGLGRQLRYDWLPVPSNIPVVREPGQVRALREQYASAGVTLLVGHFGTYGAYMRMALAFVVPNILSALPNAAFLLLGPGSEQMRNDILAAHPGLAGRLHATGRLATEALSACLSACDLMVQPYADGASARRTTLTAALEHARPVVTTHGEATEPEWASGAAAAMVGPDDLDGIVDQVLRLLGDPGARQELGRAARLFYDRRFHLRHTTESLMAAVEE